MAEIDTEDLRPPTRRSSNNDILLDILKDVHKHGEILAGIAPQITQLVEQGKQTQSQLHNMGERIESGAREMITVRARIDALESRPLAMTSDERAEVVRTQRETTAAVARLGQQGHEQGNALHALTVVRPLFNEEDQKDIARYLDLARRAQIQDVISDAEMKDLKKMREEWNVEASRRTTFTAALITHGTWIVAALILGVLSFALTTVFAHLALQLH